MDEGAKLWVYKAARKNLWRVSGYVEFEDLVQDGCMMWQRIVIRYPNVTHTPHRMALFKTAYTNHIHDLSKKATRDVASINETDLGADLDLLRDCADPAQDPDMGFIISQLPPAIMRVLVRMINGDPPFRRRLDGTRETNNERFCRIAALDPRSHDVQSAILQYLSGSKLHGQYE